MEHHLRSSFSPSKTSYRVTKVKNTKEIQSKIDELFSSADNFFKSDSKIIVGKVPRDLSTGKAKASKKYSMVQSNILLEFMSKSRKPAFKKGNTRMTPRKVGSVTTSSFFKNPNNRTASVISMENSPELTKPKPIPQEMVRLFSGQEKLLHVKSKINTNREVIEKKLENKLKRRKNDLLMNSRSASRKNSSSMNLRDSILNWESTLRGFNPKKPRRFRKQSDYNKSKYSNFNVEKEEEMQIKNTLSIRGVSLKPLSPRISIPEAMNKGEEVFKESFY